jgi:Fe-S cluster biogenesis protein NfuA
MEVGSMDAVQDRSPAGAPDHAGAGERVEQLLATLQARGGDRMAELGEELVRTLVGLYGAGLERVAATLRADPGGTDTMLALADDPLVGSLLLVHGLHPVDVDTRIERALDRVRPYLGSHAGGVEYLGVDDEGIARLRLQGTCNGCAASTVTVQHTIEGAVAGAAPELAGVEVEGVAAPRTHGPQPIQLMTCPPGMAS